MVESTVKVDYDIYKVWLWAMFSNPGRPRRVNRTDWYPVKKRVKKPGFLKPGQPVRPAGFWVIRVNPVFDLFIYLFYFDSLFILFFFIIKVLFFVWYDFLIVYIHSY